jgi:hypothetical protein
MRVYHPQPVALAMQRVVLADGQRGIFQTVRKMRELTTEGRADPFVIESARLIVLNCPAKARAQEVAALFQFARDHVRYVSDVLDEETLSPAWYTLHTRSGDCDDKSVMLASMLEAIGIPTRFVLAGYTDPRVFEHVYLEAVDDEGNGVALDPTEDQPAGWEAAHYVTRWVEPLA